MTSPDQVPPGDDRAREKYTGGADALDKTSYTAPHGSEPIVERRAAPRSAPRSAPTASAMPAWGWVGIVLAVIVLLVYLSGLVG